MNRKITKLLLAGLILIGTAFLPRSGQAVTCCYACGQTYDACISGCASSPNRTTCDAGCSSRYTTCQHGCGPHPCEV
jgi:hypothetical protein